MAARCQLEGDEPERLVDYRRVKLGLLNLGEQFTYVFDSGDDWEHQCMVGPQRIDPLRTLGIEPDRPLPYFRWGDIPDQYRRLWDGDDGESPRPRRPRHSDLPPLLWSWRQEPRVLPRQTMSVNRSVSGISKPGSTDSARSTSPASARRRASGPSDV
jgi:hypothetical protein